MSSPVQPGEVIAGKYRVDAVLGHGGMGVVVAATDTTLDRRVAVKFLLPQYVENRAAVGRFLREARATARLNSEHSVRIIEVGELDGGAPFMVMEFLEGIDLGTYIEQQGALETTVAVDYILQACRGLAEAHNAGIIHRDVKPSNLFLAWQSGGRAVVKILDFGVSKMSLGFDTGAGSLTTTGQTLGSPLYMSPEQMRSSQSADARSDIWGIGVVLFELLTGARPFMAESLTELVLVINQDPPQNPKTLRPDLPDELCRVVLRCLEKNPANRYSSVLELVTSLAPFGSGDPRLVIEDVSRLVQGAAEPFAGTTKGRRGTMIQGGGLSLPGASLASSNAVSGSMTSDPWASPRAEKKPKDKRHAVGVRVLATGALVLVLGVVGLVLFVVNREAPNDEAILSAASELEETARSEHISAAQPVSSIAEGVTSSTTGQASAAPSVHLASGPEVPSATPVAVSAAPIQEESATSEQEESSKEPRAQKPIRRRPSKEPKKPAKDRLGF